MKREVFIHFAFWFAFSVFFALLHNHFKLPYWPFWIGGLLGLFLPDIDHIIYVVFTKPQEHTSQRINYLADKKALWRAVVLLYDTRGERNGLIFHTIFFQLIFIVLTFWIMSSSGSLFGRGLVFSFSIHLLVDQIIDLVELGKFDNWFNLLPFKLDFRQSKIYWVVVASVNLVIGLFI